MEIRNFMSFIEVVKTKSYTKASENLFYAQSTITLHIKQIEEYYNAPVFEKIGNNTALTDFGAKLYPYAINIVKQYEDILSISASKNKPTGRIIVGIEEIVALYRLNEFFSYFFNKYPDIEVQLVTETYKSLKPKILDGTIDIAFIMDLKEKNNELEHKVLHKESLVIGSTREYQRKRKEKKLKKPRILRTKKGGTISHITTKFINKKKITNAVFNEVWSIEILKQNLLYGNGVAIIPKICIEKEIKEKKLVYDEFKSNSSILYTQMIYHKNKYKHLAMLKLIEEINDYHS